MVPAGKARRMSGSKRTIIDRRQRATLDAATVALFARLEATPQRERGSEAFKARDKELAARLGLSYEHRFMIQSALDRETSPCHPEGHEAHRTWFRVRATRAQLLEAAGLAPKGSAEAVARRAAMPRGQRRGNAKLRRMFRV